MKHDVCFLNHVPALAPVLAVTVASMLIYANVSRGEPTDPCDPDSTSTYGCWQQVPPCPAGDYVCDGNTNTGWPTGMQAINMILTHTGKVLVYNALTHAAGSRSNLWDPVTRAGNRLDTTADNLFCSGHIVLDDGRVFAVGGTDTAPCAPPNSNAPNGLSVAYVLDPDAADPQ